MRIEYLKSVLKQDVRSFDTDLRTSDVVHAINTEAIMVQEAISEKVMSFFSHSIAVLPGPNVSSLPIRFQLGNFIHYMATFVSAFVVGFTAAWQLALITLSVASLIAAIGVIHTTTTAKLTSKSEAALSEAGNVVEQVSKSFTVSSSSHAEFRRKIYRLWLKSGPFNLTWVRTVHSPLSRRLSGLPRESDTRAV